MSICVTRELKVKSLLIARKHKSFSRSVVYLATQRDIFLTARSWVRSTWTALKSDSPQDGLFWPLTFSITPEWINNTSSRKANYQKRVPGIFGKEMYDVSNDTTWHENLLWHLLTPCWPAAQLKLNLLLAWNVLLKAGVETWSQSEGAYSVLTNGCNRWHSDPSGELRSLGSVARLEPLLLLLVLTIAFVSAHLR